MTPDPSLSDEELAKIDALAEAATPGPWYVDRGGEFDDPYYSIPGVCRDAYGDNSLMVGSDKETADFIASARADVPRLIAALTASREVEAVLRPILESVDAYRSAWEADGYGSVDLEEAHRRLCALLGIVET